MSGFTSDDIVSVKTPEEIRRTSDFASSVYHEYFVDTAGLITTEQVDHMVSLFLTPKAISESIDDGYEFFVLGTIEDPVGFISIKCSDHDMFLSKLYTRKDVRGTGAGRFMLEYLSDLCVERGLGSIWLTCNRENKPSLAFYDHMGFRIERSEDTDIGGGFVMDDYVMRAECPLRS